MIGTSLIFGILMMPFAAYQALPSFKNRIDYAIYDFKMYQSGKPQTFSDGERIVSLQIGWETAINSPLFGVGIGNLDNIIHQKYKEKYPTFEVKRPHNQFLYYFAAIGIVGIFLFSFAFFTPLFYQKNYKDALFLGFYSIVFLSFMVETTLNTAIGVGYFVFFVLLNLKIKN